MLERGKTPETYFRIDNRVNEYYERDLAEFDKESEAKAAQIRRDGEIAAETGGAAINETVEATVVMAHSELQVTVPTLTLNDAGPSALLDGSSDDKIPGVPQKKPQPSPVNRELRIDIDTLHPAQLYNLEMFRRKTLKEPPMEVNLLEYIATKSLRKRIPEPSPEPAPVVLPAPRKTKAGRDAEKAEEQMERERLAAEIVKAMGEEERDQPLPDDSADDAYDPVDERRSKRRAARGRPDSEEEDARYEMMPTQSGRRSGVRSGGTSKRQPVVIDLEGGGEGSNQQPILRKRGRPPKNPAAAGIESDQPTPKKRGRPPKEPDGDVSMPKKRGRPPKVPGPLDSVRPTPHKRGRPPKVRPEPETSVFPLFERAPTSRRRKTASGGSSRGSESALDDEVEDMDDFDGFEHDFQGSTPSAHQSTRASRRGAESASLEPRRLVTRKRRRSSDVDSEADESVVKRGRRSRPDESIGSAPTTSQQRVTRSRGDESGGATLAGPSTRTGAISKQGRGHGQAIGRGVGRSARGRGGATRGRSDREAVESPELLPARSTRSGVKVTETEESNVVPTRSIRNRAAPESSTRRGRRTSDSVIDLTSSVGSSPRTTRSSGRLADAAWAKPQKRPDERTRPATRQEAAQAPTPRRATRGSGFKSLSPAPRTPRERSRRNEPTAASQPEPSSSRTTRAGGSPVPTGRSIRPREETAAETQPARSSARPKPTPHNPKASPVKPKSASLKSKTILVKSKPNPNKTKNATAKSSHMQYQAPRPVQALKGPSDRYFNGRNLVQGTFVLEVLVKPLPKSNQRLYRWSALPPIPDGALRRGPCDGLREAGAPGRQMAASSEVYPMEDVDAALLNAAIQQVVESDASDSPTRSKGKQRAEYQEDEITVDFESEDGYAVRNMATDGVSDDGSAKHDEDDDMDKADSEGDQDFAQRFAFLQ
jgi:hypothetical protein